jgi:two-component system, NarL family, response regulator LiaR
VFIPVQRSVSELRTVILLEPIAKFFIDLKPIKHLRALSCSGEPAELVELCKQWLPCILIAEQGFFLSLPARRRQELREQGAQIRSLAVYSSDPPAAAELLHLGCWGVISQDISEGELHRAIDGLTRGELWYPRIILSDAIRSFISPFEIKQLTRREKEIFQMIVKGYRNDEIAQALFISRETVRWHQRSLYSKIGTSNRKQVVAIGKREYRPSMAG